MTWNNSRPYTKKYKRIVDLKLLKYISEKPCLVCGRLGPSDPHHVKSKGSGGSDIRTNVIPLCRKHHTEIHATGINRFCEKYEGAAVWLSVNGWSFNPNINKWRWGQDEY